MRLRALKASLLILVMFSFTAQAEEYISDPSNIPLFDNFRTPEIQPGESGIFRLTIENRYVGNMTNVTLTISIYACATSYFYKEIADVDHPPTINGAGPKHVFPTIQCIRNGTLAYVNVRINSYPDTTQGTYFVRFNLTFEYNNTVYTMKSRGYFTDHEWENATSHADGSPGKIDIYILGVDGIIPDSSFKVKNQIPIWILYICIIPLIVMLGILAILFYCQEEYNMFPWLDQGFKYWSGKLHQAWRLLKLRFR